MSYVPLREIIDVIMLKADDPDSYLYETKRALVISYARSALQMISYAGARSLRTFMSEVNASGKVPVPEDYAEYVRVFYCVGNYLMPAFFNDHINTVIWDHVKEYEDLAVSSMTGKEIRTENGDRITVKTPGKQGANDYGGNAGCFLKGYKYNSKENNFIFDYLPEGVTHVVIEYIGNPLAGSPDISALGIHPYFQAAMEACIYHNIVVHRRNVPSNHVMMARRDWNTKYRDAMIQLNNKPEEYIQALMGWRHMKECGFGGMGGQGVESIPQPPIIKTGIRFSDYICQQTNKEI